MIKSNSTSSMLMVISILTICALYVVGRAIPDQHGVIKFGYDTSFLVLIIGYILRQKSIQQLIGLLFYSVVYNLNILKGDLFQIQNTDTLHFARHSTFYILIVAVALLLPTLFDKYKLEPFTNTTNITDTTVIVGTIIITSLIQVTIRVAA